MSKKDYTSNSDLAKMIAELQTQMAHLKKEDQNNDRRDRNTTSRSCVYNRQGTSRSPRRGYRSPQRRTEERQGGTKRPYQDSRPKSNVNRRFTRDQPEERREFRQSRRSPGITRNNRDTSYKNRNGQNKRPYKQQRELPAPSENENFPQMVKLINRAVSIRHHARNWLELPEKLSKQLDEFIEGVRPPAPNEELRQELNGITEKYKNEVALAVRNHLGMALYKTGEELSKMEELDVDRAKTTASKQIQLHLRNKIGNEDLQHWSKLAADLVGTHPSVQKQKEGPSEKKRKTCTVTQEPMDEDLTTNIALDTKPKCEAVSKEKKPLKVTRKTKPRALGYTALIRRLKTLQIKKQAAAESSATDAGTIEQTQVDQTVAETNTTLEEMVVPDTQQITINWANEWSDDEITSFQLPKNDNKTEEQPKPQRSSTQPKCTKLKKPKN